MTRTSTIAVLLALWLSVPLTASDRCPDGRDCEGRGTDRLLSRRRKARIEQNENDPSVPRINAPARPRRARRIDRNTPPTTGDMPGNFPSAIEPPPRRTQRRSRPWELPRDASSPAASSDPIQTTPAPIYGLSLPPLDRVDPRNLQAEFDYFDAAVPQEEDLTEPWIDDRDAGSVSNFPSLELWQTSDPWDSSPPAEFDWAAKNTTTTKLPTAVTTSTTRKSQTNSHTLTSTARTTISRQRHRPTTSTTTPAETYSTDWTDYSSSSSTDFSSSTDEAPALISTLDTTSTRGESSFASSHSFYTSSTLDNTSTHFFSDSRFVNEWSSTTLSTDQGSTSPYTPHPSSTWMTATSSTSAEEYTTTDSGTTSTEAEWSSTTSTWSPTTSGTEAEWTSSSPEAEWTSSSTEAEWTSSSTEWYTDFYEASTSTEEWTSSSTTIWESTSTWYEPTSTSTEEPSTSTEEPSTSTPFEATSNTWYEETSTSTDATSSTSTYEDWTSSSTQEAASSYFTSTDDFTTSTFFESTTTSGDLLDDVDDWTTVSSTTFFEEATEKEAPSTPLDFLPFKSLTHLTPLEALVDEPDLQLLGGAIKANEKYPVLKKVGMTIFAPVDKAFAQLPIDMRALQNPGGMMVKKGGVDANFESGAVQRNMRRQGSPPKRQLTSMTGTPMTGWRNFIEGCNPYDGVCKGYNESKSGIEHLIAPSYAQAHSEAKLLAAKNVMEDFEKLIMFHVVKRIIPPGMIESKKTLLLRTEMKGHNMDVELVTNPDGRELVIANQARVVEVVACRNGFIYKIDGPLFPAWNPGAPNLLEAIKANPRFSRLRFLMERSGMFDAWALAGPVTMLLIPDNAWRIDGLQVPPCFFKALVRPENAETLSRLLRWTTIPGLWTRKDIEAVEWLPNGAAPSLSVTTIDMDLWTASQVQRSEAYESRHHLFDPDLKWGIDEQEPSAAPKPADYESGRVTLIEGKEVTEWDLQFYNGLGHTVAELPLRPDLDMRGMLWDCMDMFCHECPIVAKFLLKYLDGGGLLPDVTNPKAYLVPPGVRPDWMCNGAHNWFPPGWEPQEWYRYLDIAKTGNNRMAHQLALAGWRNAAGKNEVLEDKLNEAEIHLRQIWRHYADPREYMLGVKEDPNLLIGWLRNKRSLEYKPRICDPKAPKRPGVLIDTEDPWEGGEEWGHNMVSPNRESFYLAMNRDRQRRFGMDDLRYVTQWM